MTAPVVSAIVIETYVFSANRQARRPIAEERNRRGECAAAAAIAPAMQGQGSALCRGVFVPNLDDAYERRGSIGHGGGAAEYFDSMIIVQLQAGERRIKSAAPGHTIDHQEKGFEFLQTPKVSDRTGRSGV